MPVSLLAWPGTMVTALGIIGSFSGRFLNGHFPQATLKRYFAVFPILMGAYILWRTLPAALS